MRDRESRLKTNRETEKVNIKRHRMQNREDEDRIITLLCVGLGTSVKNQVCTLEPSTYTRTAPQCVLLLNLENDEEKAEGARDKMLEMRVLGLGGLIHSS